jgi:hypothetical protein
MGLFSKVASIAGPVASIAGMATGQPWLTAAGSALGQYGASKQLARQANETAAQYAQRMQQAGQMGMFRPVGVKTLYGQSEFKVDPTTGAVTSASYTPSETVQEQQGRLGVLMGQGLTAAEQALPFAEQYAAPAQGLFNLGQEYLAQTPEEARQRYMQQQMDVLRPYDIEEEQRLARTAFGRGQGGLSVGAGGNPLLQALSESRRRRDLQLAAQAEQAAQQQIGFGTQQLGKAAGLMGTGYDLMQGALAPYQSYLANQAKLESLAQEPLRLGAELGGRAMSGSQFAADKMATSAADLADVQMAGQQGRYETLSGLLKNEDLMGDIGAGVKKIGGMLGGLFTPGGGIGGGYSGSLEIPGSNSNVSFGMLRR